MNKLKQFLFIIAGTLINFIGADIVVESPNSAHAAAEPTAPAVTDFASVGYVNKAGENVYKSIMGVAGNATGADAGAIYNYLQSKGYKTYRETVSGLINDYGFVTANNFEAVAVTKDYKTITELQESGYFTTGDFAHVAKSHRYYTVEELAGSGFVTNDSMRDNLFDHNDSSGNYVTGLLSDKGYVPAYKFFDSDGGVTGLLSASGYVTSGYVSGVIYDAGNAVTGYVNDYVSGVIYEAENAVTGYVNDYVSGVIYDAENAVTGYVANVINAVNIQATRSDGGISVATGIDPISGQMISHLVISGIAATKDVVGVAPLGRIPTAAPTGNNNDPSVAFIWVE